MLKKRIRPPAVLFDVSRPAGVRFQASVPAPSCPRVSPVMSPCQPRHVPVPAQMGLDTMAVIGGNPGA